MAELSPKTNDQDKKRITVRDIAAELGLHFTTVAEALRDSPRVKEATKKKVREAAERMGYQADPMLAALSAYRTSKRKPSFQGILVWINGFDSPDFFEKGTGFYRETYLGAKKRCEELGYRLEMFWIAESGMTPERATQVLHDRKASGVIVGPMPHGVDELGLLWDTFCSVRIGYSLKDSKLTTVITDQFGNALMLHDKMKRYGFERIGFCCPEHIDRRTNNQWLGGYLAAQQLLDPDKQLKPYIEREKVPNPEAFINWVKEQKPDVIISGGGHRYLELLEKNGYLVPNDVNVVSLHADSVDGDLAGVVQNGINVGNVSVDHLVGIIHRFKVGLESHPKIVTVAGDWVDSERFQPPERK